MVAAIEKAPCTKASFTSSSTPRSSGSSTSLLATFVATNAASAVDITKATRFCAFLPNFTPPSSVKRPIQPDISKPLLPFMRAVYTNG